MYEVIDSDRALSDLISAHSSVDFYAIDTEFQRERTYYPAAGLIQLAFNDGVFLVDPLACDAKLLSELFSSSAIAVAHAVDQDLDVLRTWCRATPSQIFDTQVAAGFLGYSTPSLSTLLREFLDIDITKTDRLTDWTQRPLSDSQLEYAAGDVAHLLEMYVAIAKRLIDRGRFIWAQEECNELLNSLHDEIDPQTVWWRLKESRGLRGRARLVAQEVAAWRERRAQEVNVPSRYVLPDLAIAVIAQQVPKSIDELREIRTVDGRHLRNGAGEELLGVIAAAVALPESQLRLQEYVPVDKSTRSISTLVAAYIGQVGKQNEIDPTIIATRSDVDSFLIGESKSRLLKGWRAQLVGESISRLVRGDAALAFGESGELVLEERSHKPVT
jgi:ribonuclease D